MRKILATLAVFVLMIPAVSLAQHCDLLRHAEDLELTDQQVDQIKALSLDERKEMIRNRADLELAKLELHEMMMADNLDKAKIMKKSDEVSAIKAKMAKTRLEKRIDRMNILTAEQRAKANESMKFRGYGGPRYGHGNGGPRYGQGRGPGLRGYDGCRNNNGPERGKRFDCRRDGTGGQSSIMNEDLEADNEFVEIEDF